MKRLLLVAPFLLCSLVTAQSNSPKAAPAPTSSASAPEDVRKILADRVDLYKRSVGIVVGVIGPQGSKIYSYGKPAKDSSAVLDGDTVYEIGSMTKVFTSLILADMVQRGEVKLDDPVSKFLPATVKVPERNGRKITLLDLSTQTSGLPYMPNNLNPRDRLNPFADYTVEQLYAFVSGYELTRDIGSKYEYSNIGVGLLGHALALHAGMDYEKLVQTRILGPLKMSSTGITLTPEMRSHLAHGHTAGLAPMPNWDLPTLAGAGALRSSVNDMLKFLGDNIGLTPTPLAPAMKSMLDVRKPTGIPNLEIAMAWHIFTKDGEQIIWHNGGTGGYHTFMGFDPRTRTGVVVLSNATNDIDDIGLHLLDSHNELARLTVPKEHHEAKVDSKIFDSYAGHYELQPGTIAEVKHQGDALFIQLTGQPQFQIFPESETDFFLKVVDAQVTFVKGPDGKVTNFVLHQGGFDVPAKKTD